MKCALGEALRGEGSREPHNAVVLILYPDPAEEPACLRIPTGPHVHGGAAHLSKNLPANEFEAVILTVEVIQVREQRLCEGGLAER
jgi:hypothetical protein